MKKVPNILNIEGVSNGTSCGPGQLGVSLLVLEKLKIQAQYILSQGCLRVKKFIVKKKLHNTLNGHKVACLLANNRFAVSVDEEKSEKLETCFVWSFNHLEFYVYT